MLDPIDLTRSIACARALFTIGYLIKCAPAWHSEHERQREYRSGHDFQERPFARSDVKIELRNKPMTHQISNVDLSAVSVSVRERSDDVAIFSIHAEPGDNDKTSASS